MACVCRLLLLLGCILCARSARPTLETSDNEQVTTVAVVNGLYHDETYASILYTLAQFKLTRALFRQGDGDGIDEVMKPWFAGPIKSTKDLEPVICDFDVVIFTSFPDDANIDLLAQKEKCSKQQLVVGMVHNPSRFMHEPYRNVLKAVRPHLFTDSPHSAQFLKATLKKYDLVDDCTVDFYVRAFPYYPPEWEKIQRKGLVVQGKLDTRKRDYPSLFQKLSALSLPGNSTLLPVTLLGKTDSTASVSTSHQVHVPQNLTKRGVVKVVSASNGAIPYKDYYSVMTHSMALLPCLAEAADAFSVDKASSTVHSSLITLTPLLADEELLRAFSFLRADAVIRVKSESFDHVWEALSEANVTQVVHNLQRLRDVLLKKNIDKFKRILVPATTSR